MTSVTQFISSGLIPDLNRHSRVHILHGYLPGPGCHPLYIKREDELNPAVVGTKLRKYLSILLALTKKKISRVILIGSAHSNNVVGLS